MSYNLLEADLQFDLQPLNAMYINLESTRCSISKYRFLGSRIANNKTEMAYNLLEADFHFDLQPLNAKYLKICGARPNKTNQTTS
jgi:hypothetical protein